MKTGPICVGIIGVEADRSWGAQAHIPALLALPDIIEIGGVANSSPESGARAAADLGLAKSYADAADLIAAPEIEVVAVTVKVPPHAKIVTAALEANKHVYCEWPLGRNLPEARKLTALARERCVRHVIGTQARVAPKIRYARDLVANNFVGDVLSATLIGRSHGWSSVIQGRRASPICSTKQTARLC